jgi:predicted Fe-Mo cluster-binding NifX family protein
MKTVALPVSRADLDAKVETRFGRSPQFLIVNTETLETDTLSNPGQGAGSGAGIEAAQLLAKSKVDAVIGGELGPKAHDALSAAGIPMYQCPRGASVREAVARFNEGDLTRADVGGGGGRGGGGARGRGGGRGRGRGGGW